MSKDDAARGLILFAHGSSDPRWSAPFERIHQIVAARQAAPVALAYLERMSPTLDEAAASLAAAGVTQATLVPLFLAVGGHMRNDLPAMVAQASTAHGIDIAVRATIGESDDMIAAIADWILPSE